MTRRTPTRARGAIGGRAPRRSTKPAEAPSPPITPGDRHRMIADAAYFRAEERGFAGGSPEDDWFAAEAEIDARLASEAREPAQRPGGPRRRSRSR